MESRLEGVFDRRDFTEKCMDVEFEKGVKMERGNLLKLSSLSKMPHMSWDASDFKFYTVAIFDPDASSVLDPNRECLQFLAYNVKGNNLNTGKIFADYLPPTLSREKPRHRLVFAVYEQQGEIFPIEKPLSNEFLNRCDFHLQDWRKRYNLGNPIALNYFESEWDERQPIPGTGLLTTLVEGVQSSMHYLGEKMQAGYETVREGMHELREKVHEKKEEIRQLAEEKKEDIKEGAQDLQQQFQEKKAEVKQDFYEKKAEVREQPKIDVRHGDTISETTVGYPPVQHKIEKWENISATTEILPPTNYETLSTGQRTIPTQPVSTLPMENQPVVPSLLTKMAEGIQTGVHVLGENLQAGYEVLKEKVQEGAEVLKEKVQEGAVVIKENVQAGYEVAKDKVATGIETIKEGAHSAKENVKAGMQNVQENVQAGYMVAKENIKAGAQKVGESLTPTTTTTTTVTTSFVKPTFTTEDRPFSSGQMASGSSFPSTSEQIERFENLATKNEDLSFLNEGEPASEVKGEFGPTGGVEDIHIAKVQPTLGGFTQPTTGFNQPSIGGFNQPSTGFNQPSTGFNQPSTGFNQPSIGGFNQPTLGGYNQPSIINQPSSTFGSSTEKKPESKI